MKVSIITPVLNCARYICPTVESILGQEGDFELELIIKDGGSTDGTLELLQPYQDRCRIIEKPDSSPAEAINQGMELATGDIAGWVNADDYLCPNALSLVTKTFEEHPEAMWVTGKCRNIDENDAEIRRPIALYVNFLSSIYSYNRLLTENYINQTSTFWTLDLWHQVVGLNTDYKAAFDYELWLKMGQHQDPIYIPEYLAEFRRHSDSISERMYHLQFQEELDIAYKYTASSWLRFLHSLKVKRTIVIYNILGKLFG